ncbi:MAG: hypothetical protein M3Y39_17350 [Chloroflexota bacterium]|nr:hypothetical protein [Chloroflexota bacterium]
MQFTRFRQNPRLALVGGLVFLFISLNFWSAKVRKRTDRQAFQQENSVVTVPASASPTPQEKKRRMYHNVFVACLVVWLVALSLLLAHFFPGTSSAKVSTSAAAPVAQREFQTGIIYPRWQANAYGTSDTIWQNGIKTIKAQTDAHWIEMPVLFSQSNSASTTVQLSQSAPGITAFTSGIRAAHALGYRVFFVPLMQVRQPGGWSGSIQTPSSQQQAWFDSYWHALQPYVQAVADNGVEQMAIGTELQWLQQHTSSSLWNQLITRERVVFKNTLTYDMNWSSLAQPLPGWLKNPQLAMIGVSSYIPLLDTAQRLDPQAMPALWNEKVKSKLDALASQVGKRVLITEIGYRNSTDALYHTWEATTTAPSDPQEQAGAYNAALSNTWNDPQIAGTFFWGWDGVGRFAIKNQLATQILHKWYSTPQI